MNPRPSAPTALRLLAWPALALGALATPGLAQNAVIAGTVVTGTLRPISGAEVRIVGTDRRAVTDDAGRFRLTAVDRPEIVLEVRRLGFQPLAERVRVGDSPPQLVMRESAVSLDAIVVTGTAGEREARSIGNAVATIAAPQLLQLAPVVETQQLLTARVPGVVTLPTQGNVGTGGLTQLRGVSSLSLSNEPLVYVDGIRTDNNARAGPNIRDGRQVARINDLQPEDIESVEIIKGPAAATIYGTEASRGVIQILTRQGSEGPPRVSVVMRQGANWFMNPAGRLPWVYGRDPATGQLDSLNLYLQEEAAGRPIFQNGHVQAYATSVGGGTPGVRYYLAANFDREEGVVWYNWRRRLGARANVSFLPSEQLDVRTSLSFVTNTSRLAQAFDLYGVMDQIIWGSPSRRNLPTRGFLRAPPEAVATVDARSGIDRLIGSVQVRHQPWRWLSQRFTLGGDLGDETSSTLFPRTPEGAECFLGEHCQGDKTVARRRVAYTTLDYAVRTTYDLTPRFRATTSIGAQYYAKDITTDDVACEGFADPAVTTCGGAAQSIGSDDRIQNKTVGAYAEQQFGWKNRLFVTGALRADDNSAFGENFDFVVYPKLHATWVVNEEPFWPFSWVDAFKVRAAWGSAGQQPDVFAAVRSYQSAPGEGTLTPRNAGNPNLKPERAEELELGVDAALWNGRLGLAFTYFNKRTRDAIVASQVAPSLGFPERQLENLGVVRNWGTELALDARLLDHPTFAWDLGVGLATNGSRIETLGGLPSVLVRGAQEHREGYPLAAFFQREIASAEVDPLGRVVNVVCAGGPDNNDQPLPCVQAPRLYGGQPTPRWQGSVRTTLTVLRNLRLYGLVDFKGGHTAVMGDILASYSNPVLNNTRVIHARSDTLLLAFFALNATVQSLKNPGVIDAGFAKLREVSLAYALPRAWAGRVGVGQATITAAARNLAFLWRAQKLAGGLKVMDPEVHRGDIESELSGLTLVPFPQYAQFLVTVRLSF